MNRRILISFFMALVAAAHAAAFASGPSLKIGMIMPMSGLHGLSGEQVVAGARLYMQEHGDIIAGKKVELVVRDDAGSAETAKRLANCHDPCGSPWMMEDTGGVRASAGRGRSIL